MRELQQWFAYKDQLQRAAAEQATSECMEAAGFSYEVTADTERVADPRQAPARNSPSSGYVEAIRETLEFQLEVGSSTIDLGAPALDASDAYKVALTGSADGGATGGCRGKATAAIGASALSIETLAALDALFAGIDSSAELTEAMQQWRSCMSTRLPEAEGLASEDAEPLLEARFAALLDEAGLPTQLAVQGADLTSVPRASLLDVLEGLESYERTVDHISAECAASSGIEVLQDQWLQLALSEIPESFFSA